MASLPARRARRRLKIAGYDVPDDVDDEIDDPRGHVGNRDIDLEAVGHRQVLDHIAKVKRAFVRPVRKAFRCRSEEHTSELQSRQYLVCRLLLEKKNLRTRVSHEP